MKKTLLTLAAVLVAGTMLASCDFSVPTTRTTNHHSSSGTGTGTGDTDNTDNGGDTDTDENQGPVGLYKKADAFFYGAWDCWNNDGTTAIITNGSDGGLRITSNTRPAPCNAHYWGVNLAGGSGNGGVADLDGKGFTKIVMKLRGTCTGLYFFEINAGKDNSIGDWDLVSRDGNGGIKWYTLEHYNTAYNATTWTEVTIPVNYGQSTGTMSSLLTIGSDNEGWVEIKDIDWQKADGTSVIPTYIGGEE